MLLCETCGPLFNMLEPDDDERRRLYRIHQLSNYPLAMGTRPDVATGYVAEIGLNRSKNSDKLSVRHDFYPDKRQLLTSYSGLTTMAS